MAKEVVWSLRAQKERKEILEYWRLRNKSNTYSKKLNQLFKESVKIITDFPQIGKPTEMVQLENRKECPYQAGRYRSTIFYTKSMKACNKIKLRYSIAYLHLKAYFFCLDFA